MEPKITVVAGVLTITVPLKQAVKERTASESGKSLVLASTHGNRALDTLEAGEIKIGINVYQRNPDFKGKSKSETDKAEAEAGVR